MLELIANTSILTTIALVLLHFLWQGTVIAVLLKACFTLISKQRSLLRYYLASSAMLANLILPLATFYVLNKAESSNSFIQPSSTFDQLNWQSVPSIDNFSTIDWVALLPFISLAWLLAVSYLASKLLIELYFVNQLPKYQTLPADINLQKQFEQYVARLAITSKPKLLISLSAKVPMAIGWLKPVILLPAAMVSKLDRAQLEMLILHELAHIKRYDYLVNFIQTCIEILLFFHPSVAWVSKQMRNEREYCSDDIAVAHCGDALAYAHTLTDTAALCHDHIHQVSIPSMAMAASGGDLKQRVVRIVNHHCNQTSHPSKWLAALTLLLAIAFVTTQHTITVKLLALQTDWLNFSNDDNELSPNNQEPAQTLEQSQYLLAKQLLAQDYSNNDQTVDVLPTSEPKSTLAQSKQQKSKIKSIEAIALPVAQPKVKLASLRIKNKSSVEVLSEKNQLAMAEMHVIKNKTTLNANNTQAIPDIAESEKKITKQLIAKQSVQAENTTKIGPAITKVEATTRSHKKTELVAKKDSKPAKTKYSTTIRHSQLARLEQEHTPNMRHTVSLLKPIQVTPKWQGPKLIKALEPKYPTLAKRRGIELEVTVHFTINSHGKVDNIEFEPNNKNSYFRRAIKVAMEKWHFQPAKLDGKPVESTMTKIFSFNLVS